MDFFLKNNSRSKIKKVEAIHYRESHWLNCRRLPTVRKQDRVKIHGFWLFAISTFTVTFLASTIFNLIQVDDNMHEVKSVGCTCTPCVDSELLWFSIFFVVIGIFEDQFVIANFITFALIVLGYLLDRIKNKCMQTTVDIDSTNLKSDQTVLLLYFTWGKLLVDSFFKW